MSRKFMISFLTALFFAAPMPALMADHAAAGVNYNSSKSNSGNVTKGNMCGRLRVGKENLHVAGLVGAAMCSASECGSHDRRP